MQILVVIFILKSLIYFIFLLNKKNKQTKIIILTHKKNARACGILYFLISCLSVTPPEPGYQIKWYFLLVL